MLPLVVVGLLLVVGYLALNSPGQSGPAATSLPPNDMVPPLGGGIPSPATSDGAPYAAQPLRTALDTNASMAMNRIGAFGILKSPFPAIQATEIQDNGGQPNGGAQLPNRDTAATLPVLSSRTSAVTPFRKL